MTELVTVYQASVNEVRARAGLLRFSRFSIANELFTGTLRHHEYHSSALLHSTMASATILTIFASLYWLFSVASAPTPMTAESCARISSCDECGMFSGSALQLDKLNLILSLAC